MTLRHLSALTLLACFTLFPACRSWDRLQRGVGRQAAESSAERVNLWPLYYQDGGWKSAIWPLFDHDEQGFALRPLMAVDGSRGEVLWPWVSWDSDAEAGGWTVLPAYHWGEKHGVFPVYMTDGKSTLLGPAYWRRNDEGELERHGLLPCYFVWEDGGVVLNYLWETDAEGKLESWALLPLAASFDNWWQAGLFYGHTDEDGDWDHHGLFPLYHHSPQITWSGPAYWTRDLDGDTDSFGLFPLMHFGANNSFCGPAFWHRDAQGELGSCVVLPLFGYGKKEDGSAFFLTPLGGRGWDAEGGTSFTNVLGPVYHYQREGEVEHYNVLWPLYAQTEGPRQQSYELFPFYGNREVCDEEGKPQLREDWALAGLVRKRRSGEERSFRVLPLFSHISEQAGGAEFADFLTLYGHHRGKDRSQGHIGTPLVFAYQSSAERSAWQSLLGTVSYEREGENSEFRFLYYLYRQRNRADRSEVDLFPFVSWSNGEESGGFSFLWRLFNYQRKGEKSGGHILFIPWGEH